MNDAWSKYDEGGRNKLATTSWCDRPLCTTTERGLNPAEFPIIPSEEESYHRSVQHKTNKEHHSSATRTRDKKGHIRVTWPWHTRSAPLIRRFPSFITWPSLILCANTMHVLLLLLLLDSVEFYLFDIRDPWKPAKQKLDHRSSIIITRD